MTDFWGPHYGPARSVAWRRLGVCILVVGLGGLILNAIDGIPRLVLAIVYLLATLIVMARYVSAEIVAVRAMLVEMRR